MMSCYLNNNNSKNLREECPEMEFKEEERRVKMLKLCIKGKEKFQDIKTKLNLWENLMELLDTSGSLAEMICMVVPIVTSSGTSTK